MKSVLVSLVIASLALIACLPDVSTELPEPEARALIENQVLNICGKRSTNFISNIMISVQASEAIATRDNWIFNISLPGAAKSMEALVFPSKIVSGEFVVELRTYPCG